MERLSRCLEQRGTQIDQFDKVVPRQNGNNPGRITWYGLSGHTAVAGILTIGTLMIWLLITVINIITGFVVEYQN
jgi:hypothetical protein